MAQNPQPEIHTVRDQLTRLFALIRRSLQHFWKAVIIVMVGGALSVGVAVTKKRRYKSETAILYRQIIHSSVITGNQTAPTTTSREIGLRLQEILLARPTMRKIIEDFKLYPKTVETFGPVQAVDELRKHIEFRTGGGDTFHIAFTGPSPEVTQKVTARLADSLIQTDIQLRTEKARLAVKFLEEEAKGAQKLLKRRETELANFLAKHPEFARETQSPGGDRMGSAIRAQVQQRGQRTESTRYTRAELALINQINRIRAQIGQGPIKARVPVDPKLQRVINETEEELAQAKNRLRDLRRNLTEIHPDVKNAASLVKKIKERLARVKRAARNAPLLKLATSVDKDKLKAELTTLRSRLAYIRRNKRSGKTPIRDRKTDELVETETRWTTLSRDAREARDRYLQIEGNLFRATLKVAAETSGKAAQMQIIDPAFEPTRPVGMGRSMTVAAGLAASMAFAGLLILGLALMDDRLYDRLDIERLRVTDVLVEVPKGPRGWLKKKSARAAAASAAAQAKARAKAQQAKASAKKSAVAKPKAKG